MSYHKSFSTEPAQLFNREHPIVVEFGGETFEIEGVPVAVSIELAEASRLPEVDEAAGLVALANALRGIIADADAARLEQALRRIDLHDMTEVLRFVFAADNERSAARQAARGRLDPSATLPAGSPASDAGSLSSSDTRPTPDPPTVAAVDVADLDVGA